MSSIWTSMWYSWRSSGVDDDDASLTEIPKMTASMTHNERQTMRDSALLVGCPVCASAPGGRCVSQRGDVIYPHDQRIIAWRDANNT